MKLLILSSFDGHEDELVRGFCRDLLGLLGGRVRYFVVVDGVEGVVMVVVVVLCERVV